MTFKVTIEGDASDVKNFLLGFAGKEKDVDVQILVDNIPVGLDSINQKPSIDLNCIRANGNKIQNFANTSKLMTITDFIVSNNLRYDCSRLNRAWGQRCAGECRRKGIPFAYKNELCPVNKYPAWVIRKMCPY